MSDAPDAQKIYYEQLLETARAAGVDAVRRLPDAGDHQRLMRILGPPSDLTVRWFLTLDVPDRSLLTKAMAQLWDTAARGESITPVVHWLPYLEGARDETLDWILRNTHAYDYYGDGCRSLAELREWGRLCAEWSEERREQGRLREAADRRRKASKATANLPKAVNRGDVQAVRALMRHGADPNAVALHGKSLLVVARENGREDICEALNRCEDEPSDS